MNTFTQDVRFGIRQLLRRPGFSLVAIVTLALGIGMSTALFTVIDATMLRPLPYPNPEQLVSTGVSIEQPDGAARRPTPSMADMQRWQEATDLVAAASATRRIFYGLVLEGSQPERVEALAVTEQYLSMYGAVPVLGRDLNASDMQPGAPAVALIGHTFWQRRFEGSPHVIGEPLRDSEGTMTIVGVLPPTFGGDAAVIRPLVVPPEQWDRRGSGRPIALRLQPGVTVEDAARLLSDRSPPDTGPEGQALGVEVRLSSMLNGALSGYRTTVNVLAGAVAMVLLIACVNVAGLLLARGAGRHTEMAVRASLGAGRRRLLRQLLTESLVLSLTGGLAGLGLAWITLDSLVANVPMSLPENSPATLNGTVLAATLALTLGTGILFGLAPAFRLSRVRLGSALAAGGRGQGAALSRRGSQALIAAEVALAVVLVVGAGLMLRSFTLLSAVDVGFDPASVVTLQASPLDPAPDAQVRFYPELLRRIRSIPGVEAAGAVDRFPMGGSESVTGVRMADGAVENIGIRNVLPGYFEALNLDLVEGTMPNDSNFDPDRNVVVINESAARQFLPDGPAAGRILALFAGEVVVLGVVNDLRHSGPLWNSGPEVFVPLEPSESILDRSLGMTVVIRPGGPIPDLAARLRDAAESIGPPVLIEQIRSGSDWFGDRVVTPRRRTVLLGLLGGVGLVLALVGIFGMTAFAVARRTQEIGVRMAFGARPGQVVGSMVRDAATPIAVGAIAGLGIALLATQVIASFLFETEPTDPATFAAGAVVLAITGLLAAWIPARRAARVNPVVALRD